jgi:hypothetical protein
MSKNRLKRCDWTKVTINANVILSVYYDLDSVYLLFMLSVSHALTGAFIASKFTHPIVFIPLTLASHYLQDWIPHWDVGTGLSSGKRKRSTAILLEFGDLALTIGLVYLFWQGELTWQIGLGAFMGLLPDFMEAPRNFLKWEPFFLKPFNEFHHQFHHSVPNMIFGLLPQVAVILAVFFLK